MKTFKRAVKQARDVWNWSFHGNYVGSLLSQRLPLASATLLLSPCFRPESDTRSYVALFWARRWHGILCHTLKQVKKIWMAVKRWQTFSVCWFTHTEWGVYIPTRQFLTENRMIKLSHPLFQGGTTEVAFDPLCVPDHTGGLGWLQLGATLKQGM